MAAVIDRATRFGRVVDRAKVLPLRSSHLGASRRRARRVLSKESDDEVINFHSEESAEFVKPKRSVDALGGFRQLYRNLAVNRDHGVRSFGFCKVMIQGFEVFLELERRVKLLSLV